MSRKTESVAGAVVQSLRDAGVVRIYGVPGEDHLRLLHEIEEAGLTYVAARDESAAVIMAAAESQATGVLGVVITTLAPGLTNALNGLASAYVDHVPVLLICGQHDPDRLPSIVRQALDNHALTRPLTKWTVTAGRQIHQLMAKVIDTALSEPPGPVFLELRSDIAGAEPTDRAGERVPVLVGGRTLESEIASPRSVRAVGDAFEAAVRPIIIVGGRAIGLGAELAEAASALHAPVFTSPSAKGVIGEVDPWFAGTFVHGNIEATLLNRADLVIAVGLDPFDFFNVPWTYGARIVAVESGRTVGEHFIPVDSQVVGPIRGLFAGLATGQISGKSEWTVDEVARYREKVREIFCSDEDALTIPTAIIDARSVLPSETFATIDAGFGKSLHFLLWAAREPNSCFTAHGLSTMGYAIPAANALALAFPNRPVVGFMGDGSLLLAATEITVARQHRVAPIYVVWVDSSLSQVAIKQRREGLRTVGVDLDPISCPKIADALGGVGVDVTTRSEFREALRVGLSSEVPTLIGAQVDQTRRDGWFEQLRG